VDEYKLENLKEWVDENYGKDRLRIQEIIFKLL